MSRPLSFNACLKSALWGTFVRGPILTVGVLYAIYLMKYGFNANTSFISLVEAQILNEKFIPKLVLLWLMMFCAAVLYPYWRTRNPSYIKKMEAYERKKQSLQTGITEEKEHS